MTDLQTALTYLTLISVPVGVLYNIMTLNNQTRSQKHAQKSRQAQLYMQLYSFYDNKEFLKDYGNINMNYKFKDAEDCCARARHKFIKLFHPSNPQFYP